jgi:hypothetical protein
MKDGNFTRIVPRQAAVTTKSALVKSGLLANGATETNPGGQRHSQMLRKQQEANCPPARRLEEFVNSFTVISQTP